MVEIYLSDEEQEEALRNWWRENWRWIVSGIAIGLALLGGWKFWQQTQLHHAEEASALYLDLTKAAQRNDAAKVEQLTRELQEKYAASPYAQQANLALAKIRVEAGKWDEAAASLRDVVDHAKDPGLAQIGKLRLARVLIQQNKNDDALALLDPVKAVAFAAEVHELRGDALYAKGDVKGARGEYQQALSAQLGAGGPDADQLLELKIQDLGDAAPASAQSTKTP